MIEEGALTLAVYGALALLGSFAGLISVRIKAAPLMFVCLVAAGFVGLVIARGSLGGVLS